MIHGHQGEILKSVGFMGLILLVHAINGGLFVSAGVVFGEGR